MKLVKKYSNNRTITIKIDLAKASAAELYALLKKGWLLQKQAI
jgi:hypothetical protein